MLITVLKSKLHRVSVTDANIEYIGSCAIDKSLLDAAGIREHEQIHIYNVNNGERFTTYAIPSDVPGDISVNGSAARKAVIGDILIIAAYGQIAHDEYYYPRVIFVDEYNTIK
jgi:aspartate 1-decarboxylase